jgi:hypothetical protein
MAASTVIKNFRDGTIIFADGTTPTPLSVTVTLEGGDFSLTGLNQLNTEATTYLDRGELGSVRLASRSFPSISLTCHMADLSDATDKLIFDAINKTGAFSAALSTITGSDVYGLKITLTIEGTNFSDPADHTIVMSGVHCTIDFSEGDPNSFSISGTVYGSIVTT